MTAYQDLPTHLRNLADELWAVHSNAYDYATGFDLPEDVKAHRAVFTSTVYETLHPVVRIHPESGERGLFIGGFVRQFRGLSTTESDDILRLLQAYVTRPENTVRWRWQVGDVAFGITGLLNIMRSQITAISPPRSTRHNCRRSPSWYRW